jgi:hypothetical protein
MYRLIITVHLMLFERWAHGWAFQHNYQSLNSPSENEEEKL